MVDMADVHQIEEGRRTGVERKDVIGWLKNLREAREELEEAEADAKEYRKQVSAEIEADLEPMRALVGKLQDMLLLYIKHENDGKKIKVPGLGTATIRHDKRAKIVDEDAFFAWASEQDSFDLDQYFPRKIATGHANALARDTLNGYGELLPGVEVEDKETISFRTE